MGSLNASRATRFLFLICVFWTSQVSSQDTLGQGDRLNSTARLISAGGKFTLGFYTPSDTNNSYLAIQFANELVDPVWIGNRDKPFSQNSNPVLTIDSTGKLVISTTGGGESVEIYSGGSSKNIAATLLDTGNFVVKDMSTNGEVLWQSFDHPTDTLLPGMKLGVDHRTGRNWTLSSWFGPSNPATGAFTLEWDPNSGMLLVRWRGMIRWSSGKIKDYYMEPGSLPVKEFENSFTPDPDNFNYNFTNVTSNDEEYFVYSLINIPGRSMERRTVISGWRLTYDGDIFDTDRGSVQRPSLCYGYNSKTKYVDRGCEVWEQPKCRNTRETFVYKSGDFRPDKGQGLRSIHDANSSLTLSDCRDNCWKNCKCAAYIDGTPGCVYWEGTNLEYLQSVDGSFIRRYFLESAPASEGMKSHIKIILPVVSAVALLLFGIGLFVVRKIKQGKRQEELQELLKLDGYTENNELENGGAKTHDLKLFTYASIQSATRNFSLKHKLGQGGFGPVYKGKTAEGQDIAVKLLSQQSGQGLLEFKTELVLISKLQHVNLVKLLGFCIHGNDKMIIYEYMPNKSLDFYIFSPSGREQLDWPCRFSIIEGIAQGLLYLHRYSRLKIIHRDMKPSNILLDENLNPKISDFGLARIFTKNIDEANTNKRVGTYGYMAPEYAMQGIFSVKSDVYSFGVLLLEIVSGRKNSSFHEIEGPLNLVEHAWELWKSDCAVQVMDPLLKATCVTEQLRRCIHVGLLCVENHAADRPATEDVISMLKNDMADLPMPRNPAFVTRKRSAVEEVEMVTPEKLLSSANELTISEMGGR